MEGDADLAGRIGDGRGGKQFDEEVQGAVEGLVAPAGRMARGPRGQPVHLDEEILPERVGTELGEHPCHAECIKITVVPHLELVVLQNLLDVPHILVRRSDVLAIWVVAVANQQRVLAARRVNILYRFGP